MSDGPKKATMPSGLFGGSGKAEALATRALSVVAGRGPGRALHEEANLQLLEESLLDYDRNARLRAIQTIRATGSSWEEIVDHYLPAAARRLGDRWCEDSVSFAEVTIGVARLQSILRDVLPDWADETRSDPMAPNVLMVVRADQYHTLGAMVAAAQLRRAGISIRLSLGLEDSETVELVARKRFDAIMISASGSERLESVRILVEKIRAGSRPVPPIVLGGTILDTDRDARTLTGADHCTSDPQEALRLCGLKMHHPDVVSSEIEN